MRVFNLESGKVRSSLTHLLFLILLHMKSTLCEDKGASTKVYVSIENLPSLFSNDKLPSQETNADECYELIGCIERIPKTSKPKLPSQIKTEFQIFSRSSQSTVSYKEVFNCLQNTDECATYPFDLESLLKSPFNPKLRTFIITPGYNTQAFDQKLQDLRRRWLLLEDCNVILVAWTGGNTGMYDHCVPNTKVVARQITVLLYYLAQLNDFELSDGAFTEKIHLVGHSLGAHISGFTGQDFDGKLSRITGLDPAGPSFNGFPNRFRLDRTDAQLVDILHTNGGNSSFKIFYGMEASVGHIDYFANDGKHQPVCKSGDLLGCSHKLATEYYALILDHEIQTRLKLNNKTYPSYRLFAFRSDTFEEFQNGTSLSKLCPITTLDDKDLHSSDIYNCIAPLDMTTTTDQLIDELKSRFHISFDPNSEKSNKFYFFPGVTEDGYPYLNNHNLIKIIFKDDGTKSEIADNTNATQCRIDIRASMTNGEVFKHQLSIFEGEYSEIVVPYLSSDIVSKYELAVLDSKDFYLNEVDHSKLRFSLSKILPFSIEISGGLKALKPREEGSFWNLFQNLFDSPEEVDNNNYKKDSNHCNLMITAVMVEPLKKLHRHLAATYTIAAKNKEVPDLIVLNENEESPKAKLLNQNADTPNSIIYLDSVILGPYDKSIDTQDDIAVFTGQSDELIPTSSISSVVWIQLIMWVSALAAALGVYMMIRVSRVSRFVKEDKLAVIDNQAN